MSTFSPPAIRMISARYKCRLPGWALKTHDIKQRRELLPDQYRNVLCHTIDTKRGQSGSPAWRHIERDGKAVCQLVGVMI